MKINPLLDLVDHPRLMLMRATRDPWDAATRRHQFGECAIIAAIIAGTATTAISNAYSTNKAADVNEKSIAAQSQSEKNTLEAEAAAQKDAEAAAAATKTADLQLQRDQMAATEKARLDDLAYKQQTRDAALAMDQKRYDAYVTANQPYWATGQQVYSNLLDLAHVGNPGVTRGSSAVPMPGVAPPAAGATPFAGLPAPSGFGVPSSGLSAASVVPAPAASGSSPVAGASVADLAIAALSTPPGSASPLASATPTSRLQTSLGSQIAAQPYARMAAPAAAGGMSLMDLLKLAGAAGVATSPSSFDATRIGPG